MFKKNLIIAIILSLIIGLGGGYILGSIQQQQISNKTKEDFIMVKKSKVIQNLRALAMGDVTKISNRTLTLNYENDILSIPIKEDALINRFVLNEETKRGETQEINFEDIMVGNKISISIEIKSDGGLEGTMVSILP